VRCVRGMGMRAWIVLLRMLFKIEKKTWIFVFREKWGVVLGE
jgi:hypothetical protein